MHDKLAKFIVQMEIDMKVLEIKEMDDGSAQLVLDLSQDDYGILLRAGLKEVADEYKPKAFKVLPPNAALKGVKKVEIGEDMANWLIGIAVMTSLRERIEKESKEK